MAAIYDLAGVRVKIDHLYEYFKEFFGYNNSAPFNL